MLTVGCPTYEGPFWHEVLPVSLHMSSSHELEAASKRVKTAQAAHMLTVCACVLTHITCTAEDTKASDTVLIFDQHRHTRPVSPTPPPYHPSRSLHSQCALYLHSQLLVSRNRMFGANLDSGGKVAVAQHGLVGVRPMTQQ